MFLRTKAIAHMYFRLGNYPRAAKWAQPSGVDSVAKRDREKR